MIGWLSGTIIYLKPTELLLNVSGTGYRVVIPFTTYQHLNGKPEASVFVSTYVREDQLRLFGFHSETERDFFELLIRINGIGPTMAVSILSAISVVDFEDALKEGNTAALTRIPGIGKAKAEKLIFELSRKKLPSVSRDASGNTGHSLKNDAIEALNSLGFDVKKSETAVNSIMETDSQITLEKLIKIALSKL